jgi:hypothetical protein
MVLVKALGDIAGATGSALLGIIAADGNNTAITITAIGAVLGFAGLLVRQVVQAQRAIWLIVRAKDEEIDRQREALHYSDWEKEKLRWSYGERPLDPGPYVPLHRSNP